VKLVLQGVIIFRVLVSITSPLEGYTYFPSRLKLIQPGISCKGIVLVAGKASLHLNKER
jgi:hypothetical protein